LKLHDSIEHLFRHEYGKITAALTSKFSSYQIDLIEDAVQEALLKAMKLWSFQEMPENPSAWLYRVASNHLIDQLRRAKKSVEYDFPEDFLITENAYNDSSILSGIKDEQLKMIFACCHPVLTDAEQIMLSLKLISGFSIKEISSALLKKEDAVKKATTRAKLKFKNEIGKIEIPNERELNQRLSSVLKIIYLMFNEGYKSTEGETLVKKDICFEAIRLAEILTEHKTCDAPQLNALLSLMCFNAARFEARINEAGELVTLENQNRDLWDEELINAGMYYLDKSSTGMILSQYHLEAGIASLYTTSKNFESTNWQTILNLYDLLIIHNNSSIAALNRLVVYEKINGAEKALEEIKKIENEESLLSNHLYYSIKADFKKNAGYINEAKELLTKAIQTTSNKIEKKFLQKKLSELPE